MVESWGSERAEQVKKGDIGGLWVSFDRGQELPAVLVVFAVTQRYFIEGVTMGSVKG